MRYINESVFLGDVFHAGRPARRTRTAGVCDLLDVCTTFVCRDGASLPFLLLGTSLLALLFGVVPLPKRDERLDLRKRQVSQTVQSIGERLTNPTSANNFGNIQIPGLATITVMM